MGRLPATYANRKIIKRSPWAMEGELTLTSAQQGQVFDSAVFLNNAKLPFEVHRMIPYVIAQDNNGISLVTPPDESQLLALLRMKITDVGKNNPLTKAATIIRSLVKGSSELTWEWAEPYYLENSAQFEVVVDALTFPAIANLSQVTLALVFQGFFVEVGPEAA